MSKLRWKIAQWAERIWWKRYLKNKSVEEYLSWKRTYWENFLKEIKIDKKEVNKEACIDLGCGPAGIFMLFDKSTAVDPLLDRYEEDLAHFSKKNYPTTKFITSSIEEFQPTTAFKTIFCINAINHVNDLEKGIQKLRACADEDARLILSIDAHNYNVLKKIFQLLPGDILHPHQYNLEEYEQKVEHAGWRVTKTVLMQKAFIFNYYVLIAERLE